MERFSDRIPERFEPNAFSSMLRGIRERGEELLDLTESNPTGVSLHYPWEELREAFLGVERLSYEPHPRGLRQTREWICEALGAATSKLSPNDLWLVSGTSEAYQYLVQLLARPGDQIAVPQPSYPLFEHLLHLEGVDPSPYRLIYKERWKIDWDSLESAVGGNTKAVIIVHPNNPTGSFVSAEEKSRLFEFCAKKNLTLIADEVFLPYSLDDQDDRTSFAQSEPPILTFTLDGFSKRYGLPQMKLSWIHMGGPKNVCQAAAPRLDWIADLYLGVSTPVQKAARKLLTIGSSIQKEIHSRVRENHSWLSKIPLGSRSLGGKIPKVNDCLLECEGGWGAVLRLPQTVDEEEFVLSLLRERKTVVYPGHFFDFPFEPVLVLSLLPPPHVFQRGVSHIIDALQD